MRPTIKPRPKRLDKIYGPIGGKLNFSNANIGNLIPRSKDYSLRDSKIHGLTLKVTPKGRKVFVLRYRAKSGQERKSTLGRFPEMNVAHARKCALYEWAIINNGGDPSKDRQDNRKALTLSDFCDRYVSEHVKTHLKEKSQKEYQALLHRHILPKLGAMPIAEISRSNVSALHRSLQSTPYQANRVLSLVKAIYNKAENWEALPPQGLNPAKGIKPFAEPSRERFLDDSEQEAVGNAIAKLRKIHPKSRSAFDAIIYLFLTGCRTKEALNLRWDNIDYQRKRVLIPDSKTGKRILPIGDEVVNLLQSIAEHQLSEFVFPGRYLDRPLEGVKKPWLWICREAGLSNVRIHDIRHTFATDMTAVGSLSSAGAILGHKNPRTTARYAHDHDQTIRKDLGNTTKLIASKIVKYS